MDAMGYRLPPIASCLVRAVEGTAPTIPAGSFNADGDISEWTSVPSLLADSLSDAPPAGDISVASVAIAGDDLAVMLLAAPGPDVSIGVELGDGFLRHGSLGGDIIVRLRIFHGVVQRWTVDGWQPVGADLGTLGNSGANYELRLSHALVGEALSFPAWSARIFTTDETTGTTLDSTPTAYFLPWTDADKPQFGFTTCKEWYTQHQPIELVEMRESEDAPNPAYDRVSALARLALDATTAAFHGDNPPVMRFPLAINRGGRGDGAAFLGAFSAPIIDIAPFDPLSPETFPEGPVFRQLTERLVDMYLISLFPAATDDQRHAQRQAIVDHLVRDAFGASYFFDTFRQTLASQDPAIAFGHVLAGVMSTDQLVDAWKHLAAGASATDVYAPFTAVTPADALTAVVDTDFDGLPDNYEAVYGTDPKRADSDQDSWSDLAEVINSEDPLQKTKQPNHIMPDGIFDDWLTLFPQKVHTDEGSSNVCPVAADIDFYAALATHDELMIGAVAREFWDDEPRALWEAVIDMPIAKRQFLISVPSDSYTTTVKDPDTGKVLLTIERAFPQGRKTVEWVLRRDQLRLDAGFDDPDTVRVRIRTLFHDADGKDNYCDETAWFAPYVTK
jgi:hypothetical protein